MGPLLIVMTPPLLDRHLRLESIPKPLDRQAVVRCLDAEFSIVTDVTLGNSVQIGSGPKLSVGRSVL